MSGHTDRHRLFFVWVCSFRMWRGPAGYQCLHSIHKGQEVWAPCHWGWSYLISTKFVTCVSCCTADMGGHDGWKTKLKNWLKKEQRTHYWVSGNNEVLHFLGNFTEWEPHPEIYSGQIHHTSTTRRGQKGKGVSERAPHPRVRSRKPVLGPLSTWLCLRVSAPVPVLAETERLQGQKWWRGYLHLR